MEYRRLENGRVEKRLVLDRLRALGDTEVVRIKRTKFGIRANAALGIYHRDLDALARAIGRDDTLAIALIESGIYEARVLGSKLFDPRSLTPELMQQWVETFENWEVCDSFCMGLFTRSAYALTKAAQWVEDDREFVKRAGFVTMAAYGFADKQAGNEVFERLLPSLVRHADDPRMYVKKAVNWALRNIGKRNPDLRRSAIATARTILESPQPSARWIAKHALKELQKPGLKTLDYPRAVYR